MRGAWQIALVVRLQDRGPAFLVTARARPVTKAGVMRAEKRRCESEGADHTRRGAAILRPVERGPDVCAGQGPVAVFVRRASRQGRQPGFGADLVAGEPASSRAERRRPNGGVVLPKADCERAAESGVHDGGVCVGVSNVVVTVGPLSAQRPQTWFWIVGLALFVIGSGTAAPSTVYEKTTVTGVPEKAMVLSETLKLGSFGGTRAKPPKGNGKPGPDGSTQGPVPLPGTRIPGLHEGKRPPDAVIELKVNGRELPLIRHRD
jgi:hypothetical protein